MTSVRDATKILYQRYLVILESTDAEILDWPMTKHADRGNLIWMCQTALANIETTPIDKLSRWLGFIQGVLTVIGLVTVTDERNFSRPLFHAAYDAENTPIPPTRDAPRQD